jgi:hypothetical protein
MPKKFSPELRDRAVRMVYDRQAREGGPRAASIRAVAPQSLWPHRAGRTGRAARRARIVVSGGSSPKRDVLTRS